MNNKVVGKCYEEIAARYLEEEGLQIIERNYRNRQGEIDLIAKEAKTTVFVEVKYRKNNAKGDPLEAVNLKKQQVILKVSAYYRMKHHISEFDPVRFDVIGICGEHITWIKNAF